MDKVKQSGQIFDMDRTTKLILIAVGAAALVLLIFLLKNHSKPIKIGFIADLSSRKSQIGIAARNGVIMAVDELNSNGGIKGRKVELLIRDGKANKDEVRIQTEDLIENQVDVIIGPCFSSMVDPVMQVTKGKDTLVISPTVSTDDLTSIDDNFIRVMPQASEQGKYLAMAVDWQENKKITLVQDLKNDEYTKDVVKGFKEKAAELSINIIDVITFEKKEDFPKVVQQLNQNQSDGLVFVASGIDTGAIIQLYAKTNDVPNLYGTFWAKISEVNTYGGKAVNGMILFDAYANEKPTEQEAVFNSSYLDRFGSNPNMASRYSYESVQIFAKAVSGSKAINSNEIKQQIIENNPIQGITDNYRIDKYGDVIRKLSFYTIRDHQYELINIGESK